MTNNLRFASTRFHAQEVANTANVAYWTKDTPHIRTMHVKNGRAALTRLIASEVPHSCEYEDLRLAAIQEMERAYASGNNSMEALLDHLLENAFPDVEA